MSRKRLFVGLGILFSVLAVVLLYLISTMLFIKNSFSSPLVDGMVEVEYLEEPNFDMVTQLDIFEGLTETYSTFFENEKQIAKIKKLEASSYPPLSWMYQGELVYQHLLLGESTEAITQLSTLNEKGLVPLSFVAFSQYVFCKITKSNALFRMSFFEQDRQLGLIYLRIGEQINCVNEPNDNTCIIPFQNNALFTDKISALLAIEHFEKALNKNPDDNLSKYFIELASTAIGDFENGTSDFNDYLSKESVVNPIFSNQAKAKGVDYQGYYGGAIVDDFNGDNKLDLFACSGRLSTPSALYLQTDSGFHLSKLSGFEGLGGGVNAIQADFDNDGDLDIYQLRGGWLPGEFYPNSLLENNGKGEFRDVTYAANLLDYRPSHSASWADINLDGYLDLLVAYEEGNSILYLNQKNGTFIDYSEQANLEVEAWVKGVFVSDLNNDMLPDIYFSCYGDENLLFYNRSKLETDEIRFELAKNNANTAMPINSFPVSIFDFNQDGLNDILCLSYQMDMEQLTNELVGISKDVEPSNLYMNQGNEKFESIELDALTHMYLPMGMNYGDIDNDGYEDVYIGSGFPDYDAVFPNILLKNNEGQELVNYTTESGLGHLRKGHGIAFGDIDNNGSLDLYTSLGGFFDADKFSNALFVNSGNTNSFISLDLEGVQSNRSAIGARVKLIVLDADNLESEYFHTLSSGGSYGSSSLRMEIGLGKAVRVKELIIFWPTQNKTQNFYNLEVNKSYNIVEGSASLQLLN